MHKKLVMAVALLFLTAPFFITIKQVSAVTQNSWTSRMSMPTARTDLGTAVVKGKIFAIGGGNHDGNLSTNEMYDPVKDTWTTKASMPTSRSSFGIAVYRKHRGRGYAVDAVRILLKYGFWEQRFQKCNSVCAHSNEASMRMHTKLGFVEEGRCRRNSFFNGEYHDDVLFGMTREEFDELMKT